MGATFPKRAYSAPSMSTPPDRTYTTESRSIETARTRPALVARWRGDGASDEARSRQDEGAGTTSTRVATASRASTIEWVT